MKEASLLPDIDLFNTNASIVRDLAKAAADAAPEANVLVIANPVRLSRFSRLQPYRRLTDVILPGQFYCPNLCRGLQVERRLQSQTSLWRHHP
jgi:hypothetical protein